MLILIAVLLGAAQLGDVDELEQALAGRPGDHALRLRLARALRARFVPGADLAENLALGRRVEEEYGRALEGDPHNRDALFELAVHVYDQAHAMQRLEEKLGQFERAQACFERVLWADPLHARSHYHLGRLAWLRAYPAMKAKRQELKMDDTAAGPLPAPDREELAIQFGKVIEDGIRHAEEALRLDGELDEARGYLNLLYRLRADSQPREEASRADTQRADALVAEVLDRKRRQAQRVRVLVGGAEQETRLVRRVAPRGVEADIQGTVRLEAVIDTAGKVTSLKVLSGHPILLPTAMEAVRQWEYEPLKRNGEPVEVLTTIEVHVRRF